MANKQYPQGCGDGEEFRDNDIIGVYKPDDVPDVVDGSLNKKKTWLQVKTWIQDFVINTNTANIAQNADDIDVLENLVDQDVKTSASPTFFDVILNTVGSVRLAIIDLLSRMTATEGATGTNTTNIGTNDTDITNLQNKTPQSYKTTDDVVFNSVNTDNVTIEGIDLKGIVWTASTPQSEVYAKLTAILSALSESRSLIGNFGLLEISIVVFVSSGTLALRDTTGATVKIVQNSATTMGEPGKLIIISN